MADLKSLLKSAVSGAVNTSSDSSSELDLSKVKSLAESILGSKSLLENSLGSQTEPELWMQHPRSRKQWRRGWATIRSRKPSHC